MEHESPKLLVCLVVFGIRMVLLPNKTKQRPSNWGKNIFNSGNYIQWKSRTPGVLAGYFWHYTEHGNLKISQITGLLGCVWHQNGSVA
jgi:hypothetical protein